LQFDYFLNYQQRAGYTGGTITGEADSEVIVPGSGPDILER
jgi:hypothetical protein